MNDPMTDREGVIRLATEYIRIPKVDVRSDVSEVCIRVEGWWREFNPFENIADAYAVESAIPEAKRDAYAVILYGLVTQTKEPWSKSNAEDWFRLAHATPRQRSQAALAVLDTEER